MQKKSYIFGLLLTLTVSLFARDNNIPQPLSQIEKVLASPASQIKVPRSIRFKGDAAMRAMLTTPDNMILRVKMKRAIEGGEAFNNQPRYELAAYRFQGLFLDSAAFVVPQTCIRGIPLARYQEIEPNIRPTFKEVNQVLCLFQYWLNEVTPDDVFDPQRLADDSLYARNVGNLNVFTFLIRHGDNNFGNFLISSDSANPRLFAVDNGIAFGNIMSERGYEWRNLRVKRLPEAVVERVRAISPGQIEAQLAVVAEFKVEGDSLVPVEPGLPLDPERGVRFDGSVLQLGLTAGEIRGIYERREELLKLVDEGKVTLF